MKALIIGCGNIAGGYDEGTSPNDQVMTHARAFSAAGVGIAGVVDESRERADHFAKTWGAAAVYSSVQDAAASRPDIVSICTPNETHFKIFREVLALKPQAIICEKPLSLEVSEAERMVAESESAGMLLAVNYMRRWDTGLTALGNRVRKGDWGKLQSGRVVYTKGVFHNASHGINLLSDWVGPLHFGGAHGLRQLPSSDVQGDFTLAAAGGAPVVFQYVDAAFFNTFEIDLYFERARIRLPGGGALIELFETAGGGLPAKPQLLPATLQFAVKEMVADVVNSLQGRPSPLMQVQAREALATIRICDEIRRSLGEKK